MLKIIENKTHIFLYCFAIGVFLIIISHSFLTEGMFFDGLMYAVIAKNLSSGVGDFWHLYMSAGDAFWGHPPLAMWLQSLYFDVFGDAWIVDKLYSISTIIASAIVLILIWKEIGYELKKAWLPLLLWLTVPLVSWCATNNLLENTMEVFVLLSVLLYLRSLNKRHFVFCFLSGVMLFLAFLTKGLTGLYPLAFPFFYWLFLKRTGFLKLVADELLMFGGMLLPLGFLFLLSADAVTFFNVYFNSQLLDSLSNDQNVSTRFYIVFKFLEEIIIPVAITAIILIVLKRKKKRQCDSETNKICGVFAATALSGVIPIMISLKQSGFYMVSVFPFVAIALSAFLQPSISTIQLSDKSKKVIAFVSTAIFLMAVVLNVVFCGKIGRDKDTLAEIHQIIPLIPTNTDVDVSPEIRTDWQFSLYCKRYRNVNLVEGESNEYRIILSQDAQENLYDAYEIVKSCNQHVLLRKVSSTSLQYSH